MTEPATETQVLPPMFTARDRCDRCGAQAKARAMLASGTLLFCGHHANQYATGLFSIGAAIESEF